MRSTTAVAVAKAFLDNWVYPYGAPFYVLTDNGPQFVAKFFEAVCSMLGLQNYLTTAYHPQTNGQAERFDKTIATRLRHYIEEHQRDWDAYVQPLTYAYNMQVHRTTGTTPFDLVLTRHPPGIAVNEPAAGAQQTVPDVNMTPAMFKRMTLRRLRHVLTEARSTMTQAQQLYKANYDRQVRFFPTFKPGDAVFIDRPPRTRLSDDPEDMAKKLRPQSRGPFKVVAVHDHTVKIDENGLHNVVNIDRVSRAPEFRTLPTLPGQKEVSVHPASRLGNHEGEIEAEMDMASNEGGAEETEIAMDNVEGLAEEYAIEKIVDHKDKTQGRRYRVRWYGYDAKDDTYEPATNIPTNFVTRYLRSLR